MEKLKIFNRRKIIFEIVYTKVKYVNNINVIEKAFSYKLNGV